VSLETLIPAIEGPQTYTLDRTASRVEKDHNSLLKVPMCMQEDLVENFLPYGHILSKSFTRRGV
jgi:hypothetical protein